MSRKRQFNDYLLHRSCIKQTSKVTSFYDKTCTRLPQLHSLYLLISFVHLSSFGAKTLGSEKNFMERTYTLVLHLSVFTYTFPFIDKAVALHIALSRNGLSGENKAYHDIFGHKTQNKVILNALLLISSRK